MTHKDRSLSRHAVAVPIGGGMAYWHDRCAGPTRMRRSIPDRVTLSVIACYQGATGIVPGVTICEACEEPIVRGPITIHPADTSLRPPARDSRALMAYRLDRAARFRRDGWAGAQNARSFLAEAAQDREMAQHRGFRLP